MPGRLPDSSARSRSRLLKVGQTGVALANYIRRPLQNFHLACSLDSSLSPAQPPKPTTWTRTPANIHTRPYLRNLPAHSNPLYEPSRENLCDTLQHCTHFKHPRACKAILSIESDCISHQRGIYWQPTVFPVSNQPEPTCPPSCHRDCPTHPRNGRRICPEPPCPIRVQVLQEEEG